MIVGFGTPAVILAAAYAWLSIDHGTPALWSVIVHESGRYTLGQTVLYFHHFLREIPTVVAMSLFVAAVGGPAVATPVRAVLRLRGGLLAAGILIAGSITLVCLESGPRAAMENLNQLHTRDNLPVFGSHWRFHFLSTVWFGLAVPVTAWIAARLAGVPSLFAPDAWLHRAAWLYFGLVSIAYGPGTEPFIDPRFIGHQAREIFTHATTTLPLGLGVIVLARRMAGSGTRAASASRPGWFRLLGVVAIPVYLLLATVLTDSIASGQTDRGPAAMVAAHYFEHTLDYVLAACLVAGLVAFRWQAKRLRRSETT